MLGWFGWSFGRLCRFGLRGCSKSSPVKGGIPLSLATSGSSRSGGFGTSGLYGTSSVSWVRYSLRFPRFGGPRCGFHHVTHSMLHAPVQPVQAMVAPDGPSVLARTWRSRSAEGRAPRCDAGPCATSIALPCHCCSRSAATLTLSAAAIFRLYSGHDAQPGQLPEHAHYDAHLDMRMPMPVFCLFGPGLREPLEGPVQRMFWLTAPAESERPLESVRCAPLAQLDRASGYEPGGRKFESCRARQNHPGGFAPPDPPTPSLARRCAGSLRSGGSLAALRSRLSCGFAPSACAPKALRRDLAEAAARRRRAGPLHALPGVGIRQSAHRTAGPVRPTCGASFASEPS
jgi:hypothetical protein